MFGLLPGLINWDRLAMVDNNLAKLSVFAHRSDKKAPACRFAAGRGFIQER